MNDHKDSEYLSSPPNYSGAPRAAPSQPGVAYQTNSFPPQPQSPYVGQLPPGAQAQYQQTTTTTMMGQPQMMQPQMVPVQPQMTGQPSMMNMNAHMGMGMQQQPMQQQPVQPQSTGVMMNLVMPAGGMGGNRYMDMCANGQHARTRKYGACGIITAIVFFPIGMLALLVDVEEYCVRCGTRF